jgi:hypothetical protein
MTVAVVWTENNQIWGAADTRFSAPGITTTSQVITDHGPKLLSLNISVRVPSEGGIFSHIGYRSPLGFVFAGEVGPALATHALCNTIMQQLITVSNPCPSLEEVSEFVRRFALLYMAERAQLAPNNWMFSAIIFGWCPIKQSIAAYKLEPSVSSNIVVSSSLCDLSEPIAIGSGAPTFYQRFSEIRATPGADGRTARLPLLVVEHLALSSARPDIGGDVQLGYADATGFRHLSRYRPGASIKSLPVQTYLGINVDDLGMIGPCKIGFWGLA